MTILFAVRIACCGLALVALLALLDAGLIFASVLIADRAPVSAQAWIVSLTVIAIFGVIAALRGGIGRQAGRLGALAPTAEGASSSAVASRISASSAGRVALRSTGVCALSPCESPAGSGDRGEVLSGDRKARAGFAKRTVRFAGRISARAGPCEE